MEWRGWAPRLLGRPAGVKVKPSLSVEKPESGSHHSSAWPLRRSSSPQRADSLPQLLVCLVPSVGRCQCPYGIWGVVPGPSGPSSCHLEILPLSEPNDESGANVDASKMWRDDREQFYKVAKQIVQKSLGL